MSYKSIHAFGLDISDFSIELVALNRKRKVILSLRENLPFGIVINGKIKDKEALAETIIKLKEKAGNKLETENVVISLAENNAYAHILNIPTSLINDAKVVLKMAQEHIPLNLNETIFDYKILKEKGVLKKETKIFFVAAEDKMIYDYLEVLNKVKLKPIAIDINPNSIVRAIEQEDKKKLLKIKTEKVKKKKTTQKGEIEKTEEVIEKNLKKDLQEVNLSLDFGSKHTLATIFLNGFIFPSISIQVGGHNFSQIVLNKLKAKDFEDAEKIKKKMTEKSPEYIKVKEEFAEQIQKIIAEVKDFISYFEKNNDAVIKTIYLSGGSSRLPELEELLKSNFNLEIKKAKANVLNAENFESDLFLNATGLALRGISKDPVTEDINLLPAVQKRLLIEQQAKNVIIYSSLVVLFVSSLLLASFNIVLSNLYFDLEGLQKANDSFQKITEGTRYQEIQAHIQELNDTVQVAKQTLEQTYSLQEIRNYFYAKVPTTIVINQFNYSKKDKTHSLNVNGFALTREKVLELQEILKGTPFYKNLFAPLSNILNQKNIYFSFSFDLDLEKFKEFVIEEIKRKEAAAKAEQEQIKANQSSANKKKTPAFRNADGTINETGDKTPAFRSTDGTSSGTPIIDLKPVDQGALENFNNNLGQISDKVQTDTATQEEDIQKVLTSSGGEAYPFQEKIHEKVGDVFIIEQNFNSNTNP